MIERWPESGTASPKASSRQSSGHSPLLGGTALAGSVLPCQHPSVQRCLYTNGKWWYVCQTCNFQWSFSYEAPRQREMFTLEVGDSDKP